MSEVFEAVLDHRICYLRYSVIGFLSWCISVELGVFQGAHKVLDSLVSKPLILEGFLLHLSQTFRAKSLKYHQMWVLGLSSDVAQA